MKRLIVFGLVFLLAFGNALAQQAPVTFTTSTTLVIIDVTVKDKAGKVVEDQRPAESPVSRNVSSVMPSVRRASVCFGGRSLQTERHCRRARGW